jgi:hypothetical protein
MVRGPVLGLRDPPNRTEDGMLSPADYEPAKLCTNSGCRQHDDDNP